MAPAAAKRAPTAYFLFADSARSTVREELVAAASDGGEAQRKVSVAAVAKAIGERWKALSDDEREEWKRKAVAKGEEIAAAAAAAATGDGRGAEGRGDGERASKTEAAPAPVPTSFPLSIVRKIIALDPEVARVSGDAAKAISAAAAAFASSALAVPAAVVFAAREGKRRTVRASDVARAANRDTRCQDMGLVPVLEAIVGCGKAGEGTTTTAASKAPRKENAAPSAPGGKKRGPVAAGDGGGGSAKKKGKAAATAKPPARPAAAFFQPYKGGAKV